jgi:transaldolase
MKFFIDTADIAEIRSLAATGLVDGVTTNPSLVAKSGRRFLDAIAEICSIVGGPVSAEVTATEAEAMVKEGPQARRHRRQRRRQGAAHARRAQGLPDLGR